MSNNRWISTLTGLLIAAMNTAVIACPLCKDSVPNGDTQMGGSLPASGMNYSIYFMLAGFFMVLGMVSGIVIKGVRDTNNHGGPPGFPLQ